jgi:uncharacterized protein
MKLQSLPLDEVKKTSVSEEAFKTFCQREGDPLFFAAWKEALFIHFEIEPSILQEYVPFQIALHNGKAFMSLVAFQQTDFHPRGFSFVKKWLGFAFANHAFLNLRTYVQSHEDKGIHFISEWVSSPLATTIAPRVYGFPYRWSKISLTHSSLSQELSGEVHSLSGKFSYTAVLKEKEFHPVESETLDDFLVENYIAFTQTKNKQRSFRVWHEPWPQIPVDIQIQDLSLFSKFPWFQECRLVGANFSPGVDPVWIGRPRRLINHEYEA